MGDLGSIPGLGRSPGDGNGYPLQYSGLENSTDCIVHRVANLDTTERLSLSLYVIIGVEAGNLNKTRWSVLLLQGIGENAFLFL